jgi:alpha-beta hydrolase superfamily lysophospholipase
VSGLVRRFLKWILALGVLCALSFWITQKHQRCLPTVPAFEKHVSTFNAHVSQKKNHHQLQDVVLQVPEDDAGHIMLRRGELILRSDSPATVILFHGFKCRRSDVRPLRTFMFPDYNTLIFDFRAHGVHARKGECCSFGVDEVKDVKAAVDFVRSHPQLKDKPVIAYGISMGAAAVIEAQASYDNRLFDAIIIDSPFDSMENVINRGLNNVRYIIFGYDILKTVRILLQKSLYSPIMDTILKTCLRLVGLDATSISTCLKPVCPVESIKQITVPCFIIGCSRDETIPVEAFEKVYENAGTTEKELWIVDGNSHVDTFSHRPEEYIYKVRAFVTRVLSDLKIKAWKSWILGNEK